MQIGYKQQFWNENFSFVNDEKMKWNEKMKISIGNIKQNKSNDDAYVMMMTRIIIIISMMMMMMMMMMIIIPTTTTTTVEWISYTKCNKRI